MKLVSFVSFALFEYDLCETTNDPAVVRLEVANKYCLWKTRRKAN